MELGLQNKKALVFGSSMGIGKAIAQSLINEGATVCLSSRNKENIDKCAQEIKAQHTVVCDLSKPGEAKKAIQQAKELMSGIDILVLNTGGPKKNNFMEVTQEQWKTDFQSLWLSSVEAMHETLPAMKDNNFGRILFVTSVAAKEPMSGLTTSNGLRAGLNGLVKSVCHEVASYGITLNLILPGFTDTERLRNLNLSSETVKQLVPAGRLGRPDEIGNLAAFLSSDLAGYINGQSIAVDGGYLKGH